MFLKLKKLFDNSPSVFHGLTWVCFVYSINNIITGAGNNDLTLFFTGIAGCAFSLWLFVKIIIRTKKMLKENYDSKE